MTAGGSGGSAFEAAVAEHRAGRLVRARHGYEMRLAERPDDVRAQRLLRLLRFQDTARRDGEEDVGAFMSAVLDQGPLDDGFLRLAGEIMMATSHAECAAVCFRRAADGTEDADRVEESLLLFAKACLQRQQFEDCEAVLSQVLKRGRVPPTGLIDDYCNRALWAGRHAQVAHFIATHPSALLTFQQAPDGYYTDALLAYAAECHHELFRVLTALYQELNKKPCPHADRYFLPTAEDEVVFSSHGFAGTSAFVNLLLLLGVRVDEIARRYEKVAEFSDEYDLWALPGPSDDLPARMLRRTFLFRRALRCYSTAHRLPNHLGVAGRKVIFALRDPRVALVRWFRPTTTSLESGAFGRFIRATAPYWCSYVDALERFENRLVVRFEDWQADPIGTAQTIARYLGISPRPAELEEAVYYSSTDVARGFRAAFRRVNLEDQGAEVPEVDPPLDERQLEPERRLILDLCESRMRRYGYEP